MSTSTSRQRLSGGIIFCRRSLNKESTGAEREKESLRDLEVARKQWWMRCESKRGRTRYRGGSCEVCIGSLSVRRWGGDGKDDRRGNGGSEIGGLVEIVKGMGRDRGVEVKYRGRERRCSLIRTEESRLEIKIANLKMGE